MNFCTIICEFNPFHNGHAYLISRAKELTGCDAVICVMSGSFTQRGEICRTDKFLRARHAVLCGADAVIELPAPFAVAPAEIFAKGAIKVISRLGVPTTLAFGCENSEPCEGDEPCEGSESNGAQKFIKAAEILSCESQRFKSELKRGLDGGESYIKSYSSAFTACGGDGNLLSSPNNILGVEYVKAIAELGAGFDVLPVKRVGAGYRDETLAGKYSSAGGIRANACDERIREAMPDCSYRDFIRSTDNRVRFERLAADMLFTCDKNNLKRIYGCTEGLENRLKNLAGGNDYAGVIEGACTKRYSMARISRILCANLLELYADQTERFLKGNPHVKILAVKKERADGLLPLLTVKGERSPEELACAEITSRSYSLWRHLSTPLALENPNEKMILV